jgi:hypothetical protein
MASPARPQALAWEHEDASRQARAPGERALREGPSASRARALPWAGLALAPPVLAAAQPPRPAKQKLQPRRPCSPSPPASPRNHVAIGSGAGVGGDDGASPAAAQDELELWQQASALLGGAKQVVEALRAEVRALEQRLAASERETSAALSHSSRSAAQLAGVLRAVGEALGEPAPAPRGVSTEDALARLVAGARRVAAARDAARSESRRLSDELAARDRERASQRGFELALQRSEADKRALVAECAALRSEAERERAAAARERSQAVAALEATRALVRVQNSEMAGAAAAADASAAERIDGQARHVSVLSAQVARLSAKLAAERDASASASHAASQADARAAAAETVSRRAEAAAAEQAQQLAKALAANRHHDLLIDVEAKVRAIRAQHSQHEHGQHVHHHAVAATTAPLSPAQRRAWRRA